MSDCHSWAEDDFGIHQRLLANSNKNRIPIRGSFALTHRCTLRCRHCYLGSQEEIRKHQQEELSTSEVEKLIDQASSLGTLYMMITGGEVMLRKDFSHIYKYIAKKGILISVLTNGTLITNEIINLFKQFPPRIVEITSYGATSDTYENITQTKGSYKRYINGLDQLKRSGIRFSLKSVIMNTNQHELLQMEKVAVNYGVKFRYDTAIFPCIPHNDNAMQSNIEDWKGLNGIKNSLHAPVSLRISVNKVLELDFKETQRSREWLKFYEWAKERSHHKNNFLYLCSAGRTAYHINPYGTLQPCLLTNICTADLRKLTFQEGWTDNIAQLLLLEPKTNYSCSTCKALDMCAGCPSVFHLEEEEPGHISEYICDITKKRLEILEEIS